jgi:hypothetical protein
MDEFSKIPDVRVTRFNPILREIYNLAEGCEEKMETQNEATMRAHTESIAQDNECHARQPEQEQHMTICDTQASAEDSDNVDFVPPVLPTLAVPAIIHERADFAVYTSFTGEEVLHVYDVTVTGVYAELGLAAWHGEDEYTSAFADKGQRLKDKKHSRYEQRDTTHGLAFCSVGSLAEGAAKAINYLYAKTLVDSKGIGIQNPPESLTRKLY